MNRIQLATQTQPQHDSSTTRPEEAVLRTGRQENLCQATFIPLHYEKNYAYPLLVWLHSDRDDQRQLQRLMPLVSMRNYLAVAPRGVCIEGSAQRYYGWRQTPQAIEQAEKKVLDCIALAKRDFHIADHRVFVAGYGSGGTMALRLGLRKPQSYAGVLSIGGPFPCGDAPLLNLDQARHLPFFITQGRSSQTYPIDLACRELRLFHAAGMCVTVRQYPGGDEVTTQMLHDMNVWLMERVTGQAQSTGEAGVSDQSWQFPGDAK